MTRNIWSMTPAWYQDPVPEIGAIFPDEKNRGFSKRICSYGSLLLWITILFSCWIGYICLSNVVSIEPSILSSSSLSFMISSFISMSSAITNDVTELSSISRIKVACVGDSITYGYGASTKGRSYPSYLHIKTL